MPWLVLCVIVAILAVQQPTRPHHISFSPQEADSHQEALIDGSQLLVNKTEKEPPTRPTGRVCSERDLKKFPAEYIRFWCDNPEFAPKILRDELRKYCPAPKKDPIQKEVIIPAMRIPSPCPSRLVRGNKYRVVRRYSASVSAYNSVPEQTDDTPTITSTGATVYCGVVASNGLVFGTIVRFPELYGEDTLFFVEDRMKCIDGMKKCKTDPEDSRLDIWFPKIPDAKEFGRRQTVAEVVEPREKKS
jgi:3D (Asp-Asp-Asp) domain-containing protein